MAERMVPMDARMAIAAFQLVDDGQVNVSQVCRELGVSRDSYYRYRRRFLAEGWTGMLPQSRRPGSSPGQTASEVEDLVVAKRVQLIEQGWDAGARSIRSRLLRDGVEAMPSVRTVHRILVRRGLVEPQPAKRPRSTFKSFEHPAPNACWQLDGTGWHLGDGTWVCILRVSDDHSRMILASRAAPAETTIDAWACVQTAIERHGAPTMLLSDGGAAFTQRRRGSKSGLSDFEARLRAHGIHPVVSSPFHPQTCGKKERDWQPLKRWLNAQLPATTLPELQRLLDAYDVLFNTDRPHQGIGDQTPAERYGASPKTGPAPGPLPAPCQVTHPLVTTDGRVGLGNDYVICIGAEWTGHRVTVVRQELDVVILNGAQILVRHRIDPTRKRQLSGRDRWTTRRRNRLLSEQS